MSFSAQSITSELAIKIAPQQMSCCEVHKGKLITALVCTALALMVSGGVLYYFSIFKNIICYSLIGAGGVVGLSAAVTALILYQVCSTTSIKTQESGPKPKVGADLKSHQLPVPPSNPRSTTNTPSPPPMIDSLEHLISLRQQQGALPLISRTIPPLASLCLRTIILDSAVSRIMVTQQNDKREKTVTRLPTCVFSSQAPRVFRFGKDLHADHVRHLIRVWPPQYLSPTGQEQGSSADELNLNGCNHLELDPSILVHNQFKLLKLAGCKFKDINAFATSLSTQSNLHTLTFDHESMLTLFAFHKLTSGCSKLKEMTVSVMTLPTDSLFTISNQLEYLNIQVSSLSSSILSNILLRCPKLKDLNLWYTNVAENTDIRKIITSLKSSTLRHLNIIVDSPLNNMKEPYYETIGAVEISVTQTYTQSLFGHTQPHEYPFWFPSFIAAVQRYAHDPEKLNTILRQVAQRGSNTCHLNQLPGFGIILASHLNWMDWSALEHIFTPFDLEFPNAPDYNFVLELLLQSTLTHCLDKMQENESEKNYGSFYTFNSEVLTRILHTHRDFFLDSDAIRNYSDSPRFGSSSLG